jgi:hypothetical protein
VTVEEQFRGWLALIAQQRPARRQVLPYEEHARLIDFFADYSIAVQPGGCGSVRIVR